MTPGRHFFGVLETNISPAMRFITRLSENRGPKRAAHRGFTRPTKNYGCLGVPIHDKTVQIECNKSIRSSLDNSLGPRSTLEPGTGSFEFSVLLTEHVGVGFHESSSVTR